MDISRDENEGVVIAVVDVDNREWRIPFNKIECIHGHCMDKDCPPN